MTKIVMLQDLLPEPQPIVLPYEWLLKPEPPKPVDSAADYLDKLVHWLGLEL